MTGSDAEPSDDTPPEAVTSETVEDAEGSDGSDSDTRSPSRRHWLTNDVLAGMLVLSLVAVVAAHGAGSLNLQTLPQWLVGVYSFSIGASVTWAFGQDAVEAWRSG